MGLIASSMWLWLILCALLMAGMWFYHQKKSDKGLDTSSDFSNTTMFFDPIKGEGDVFVGGILSLVMFSLFLWNFTDALRMLF